MQSQQVKNTVKDITFCVVPINHEGCYPARLENNIPVETPLMMSIWFEKENLDKSEFYYVVTHQENENPFLLAPSLEFGHDNQVKNDLESIPGMKSWARYNQQWLEFYEADANKDITVHLFLFKNKIINELGRTRELSENDFKNFFRFSKAFSKTFKLVGKTDVEYHFKDGSK